MRRHWIEKEADTLLREFDDASNPDDYMKIQNSDVAKAHLFRTWIKDGRQIIIVDRDTAEEVFRTNSNNISKKDMVEAFPYYAAFVMVDGEDEYGLMAGFDITYDTMLILKDVKDGDEIKNNIEKYESIANDYTKLLYYISAVNVEIEPAYEPPKKITKKTKKQSQAHIYHAGFKMGAAIRAYKRSNGTASNNQGGTKRPHIRRAHWHHFWVGSNDNRKKIVKWLPPIHVGKDIEYATGHMIGGN